MNQLDTLMELNFPFKKIDFVPTEGNAEVYAIWRWCSCCEPPSVSVYITLQTEESDLKVVLTAHPLGLTKEQLEGITRVDRVDIVQQILSQHVENLKDLREEDNHEH